jgi:hypothetical protein
MEIVALMSEPKLRLFIAGASSQRMVVREVIDSVIEMGHDITYDWTRAPEWDLDRELEPSEAAMISRVNRKGVRDADGVIWVNDGDHPSKGAHYEAGLAEGLGIPLEIMWCEKTPTSWIHT